MTPLSPRVLFPSLAVLPLALIPALPAASAGDGECGARTLASVERDEPSIVETAVAAGDFETLVAALKAADLVEALEGEGPFTVFAPTDAAFAALPAGTVPSLLKPENREQLTGILTYHVVPGRLDAAHVVGRDGAVSLNGQKLAFSTKKMGEHTIVRVDGARVVRTDIACRNGVIHVIDAVVLPSEENLVKTAAAAGNFQTLLAAATAAGLAPTLAEDGPFTIFAPTDAAFAALPEGTLEDLLKPENKDTLVRILKHHVVAGRMHSEDVLEAGRVKTLLGTTLTPNVGDDGVSIGGARLVTLDLDASNGVIHVIDGVLLP